MSNGKKAAIDLDDIRDKPLDQVSAADFLTALSNSGQLGASVFRVWPEKKKYELWLEPEFNKGINIGALVSQLPRRRRSKSKRIRESKRFKNS